MTRATEQELREYARENAKTIIIRSYVEGSSRDTERRSTKKERLIIESIIFGALVAIRNGAEKQTAKDTAEFISHGLLPDVNGYDTIYNRIGDCPLV